MEPDPVLRLAPMSEATFEAYLARSIPEYAEDEARAGSWIYDIAIEERHRGRRLGRAALKLAEDEMQRRGSRLMALHVFGWNARVISLYGKSGYGYVDMVMSKPIG